MSCINFLISTVIMVGVLLVNARNAFNSANHVTALWNARVVWPIYVFLFPVY